MEQVSTVGLDLAKNIFQAHGVDASGEVVFRKKLGRGRLLAFFAGLSPSVESRRSATKTQPRSRIRRGRWLCRQNLISRRTTAADRCVRRRLPHRRSDRRHTVGEPFPSVAQCRSC